MNFANDFAAGFGVYRDDKLAEKRLIEDTKRHKTQQQQLVEDMVLMKHEEGPVPSSRVMPAGFGVYTDDKLAQKRLVEDTKRHKAQQQLVEDVVLMKQEEARAGKLGPVPFAKPSSIVMPSTMSASATLASEQAANGNYLGDAASKTRAQLANASAITRAQPITNHFGSPVATR